MSTDATPAPPRPPVKRLTPDDPRLSFDGITGWSPEGDCAGAGGGLLPLRMPLDRLDTTLSANLARLARTTAGVRFAVRTDAASIELEVENSPGGSPLDVRVDGLLAHRWTGGPGRHRIAFALPGGGARPAEVEVWLPHLSATRIAAVSLSGHRSPPVAVDRPGARWVVYGSSMQMVHLHVTGREPSSATLRPPVQVLDDAARCGEIGGSDCVEDGQASKTVIPGSACRSREAVASPLS
ncbi:hypothetical protein SMICM17S_01986 [Streptomyces microflavus]